MFSPYYAWARRRGRGDPLRHCAVNVALYGRGISRWAMTERDAEAVDRGPRHLSIGRSAMAWQDAGLRVQIDELAVPLLRRVRGHVRLWPARVERGEWALDPTGRHRWCPIAPRARAEIVLERPAARWSGDAYLDCNVGDQPLEADFRHWDWSRASVPAGTIISYDVMRRDATPERIALLCRRDGIEPIAPSPVMALSRTQWRIARSAPADPGHAPTAIATLEDTPFYARSIVATRLHGHSARAMHETLSLTRFRSPLVQAMLPFRMPRAIRGFGLR
ncbi:MAG: carotenoid 1,2-hydratase [Acetobacteraceae bacterium]|nr:carotenoid 1,2-hydratase [Acetobacteraceae bacterium]